MVRGPLFKEMWMPKRAALVWFVGRQGFFMLVGTAGMAVRPADSTTQLQVMLLLIAVVVMLNLTQAWSISKVDIPIPNSRA